MYRNTLLLFICLYCCPIFAQQTNDAQYWVQLGNAAQEPGLKISYYSAAIRIEPRNPQIYTWRGMAKRGAGKYRESVADFDSAVFYRPNYELALSLRGDSYLQLKQYEQAVRDFKQTLSVNPQNDFALSRWGEVQRIQQKSQAALALFTSANNVNPKNDYALIRRAALYLEAKQLDSAGWFATKTLEVNALSDWAWQILGEVSWARGDYPNAIRNYETAIAKNPLNEQHKIRLSAILIRQKQYNKAIDLLYAVLDKNPSDADAKKQLAQAEKNTKYRPLRPRPKSQEFRTGLDIVAKTPPPLEQRPKSTPLAAGAALPVRIDHSSDICPPRMQGGQGSCGAFAISYLAAYHEKKETGRNDVFSPAYLYHLSNHGVDKGVLLTEALENWRTKGICREYVMPYNEYDHLSAPSDQARTDARKYRIQGSFPLWTLDEARYQLATGSPLIISVIADQSLWELRAEPWTKRYGKENGAHAMLVVGYDDEKQALKVLNSWGRGWGDGGYGWIAYSLFDEVRLQLFVTKDAVNVEEKDYADLYKSEPDPEYNPGDFSLPFFNFGVPEVHISGGRRNTYTGMLDVWGYANVPPLSGYFAQIVVYYYDAGGYKIASQMYPYVSFDGQACHATQTANLPFLGLPNEHWGLSTPSAVFPYWHVNGAAIMAQPVLFIDGFQAAVGPMIAL